MLTVTVSGQPTAPFELQTHLLIKHLALTRSALELQYLVVLRTIARSRDAKHERYRIARCFVWLSKENLSTCFHDRQTDICIAAERSITRWQLSQLTPENV